MVSKVHYKQRHFLPRTAFVVAVFLGSLLFLSNSATTEYDDHHLPSSFNYEQHRNSRSLLSDYLDTDDPEVTDGDDSEAKPEQQEQ